MEFGKDKEIDLSELSKLLITNNVFLFLFTVFVFAIGCLRGLNQERIWESYFQIAIYDRENIIPLKILSKSEVLPTKVLEKNGFFAKQNIMTEIKNLKNSSVFMPIFNKFKKKKWELI